MGRVKMQLKKIENKTYRHITFAKRKSGLLKKAYELSTLCAVEVALIIFSPAGKLFLFDGNKRIEEIFAHYIDLPARRRGWLQNQELIRRMITHMNLEAGFYDNPIISRDIDTKLKEIQKEILISTSMLEDVENQLQYFLRNPCYLRSMSEITYQEVVLEETLKLVHFRKSVLEANCNAQQTSKEFGNQVDASVPRSLDYNLMTWPSQNDDHLQAPPNFNPAAAYMYPPSASANFPPRNMDTIHNERGGAAQGEEGTSNFDSNDIWFLR